MSVVISKHRASRLGRHFQRLGRIVLLLSNARRLVRRGRPPCLPYCLVPDARIGQARGPAPTTCRCLFVYAYGLGCGSVVGPSTSGLPSFHTSLSIHMKRLLPRVPAEVTSHTWYTIQSSPSSSTTIV